MNRTITRDVATGDVTLASKGRRRTTRLGELTFGTRSEDAYAIRLGDPASAAVTMRKSQKMERPGWSIRMDSQMSLVWDEGALRMDTNFQAFENGEEVFSRTWLHRFPWIDR